MADIAAGIDHTRAQMRLSQERFDEAYSITLRMSRSIADLPPDAVLEIERIQALSENGLRHTEKAKIDLDRLLRQAQSESDRQLAAEVSLTQAIVLERSDPAHARASANAALDHYSHTGQRLSQWVACYELARIAGLQKDSAGEHAYAKQALDILGGIEQTWGSPIFDSYSSRPDIHRALRELKAVTPR
jgi:hypothetical protein